MFKEKEKKKDWRNQDLLKARNPILKILIKFKTKYYIKKCYLIY